jgi:hypothetical protein
MLGFGNNAQIKENLLKRKRRRVNSNEALKNTNENLNSKSLRSLNNRKPILNDTGLKFIKESPTIKATEADFKDPISFIQRIWKHNKTGIAKIIPPPSWVEFNRKIFDDKYLQKFNQVNNPIETRTQTLNKLFYGKVNYL